MLLASIGLTITPTILLAGPQTIVLNTEAQNTAPKWISGEPDQNREIVGLCADILRTIEKQSDSIRFRWGKEFVPIKRIFKHLADGKIDLVVGYAYNPQRAKQFIYSKTVLYNVNHVLAVRRNDPVSITSFDELAAISKQGKVLTVFGGATATYLKQYPEIIVDDRGKTPEVVLQRLLKKRGRFFYYYDYSMTYTIKRNALQNQVTILPNSFQTYPHYIIYSRKLSHQVINEIETIIAKLHQQKVIDRIFQSYTRF